jgi:integrase
MLPPRYAHQVMGAFRQVCAAAVRWGYMTRNPAADAGENPGPPRRPVRAFTSDELAALEAELDPAYAPLVPLAAATGLRATFASNALAAGVTPFELAKVMGTSVRMLERHYGTLIAGAGAGIVARLDAHDVAVSAGRPYARRGV